MCVTVHSPGATAYNLLSVPLAAGVLAPLGFVLPPAAAAVAMSLSTIIVAANAQLLRRLDLAPERVAAALTGTRPAPGPARERAGAGRPAGT